MTDDGGNGLRSRQVEDRLIDFIRGQLLAPGTAVGRDDDLLSGDLLDSIAVLRLATFVEEELGIVVQPADFVVENFRTIAVLADYVRSRSAAGS